METISLDKDITVFYITATSYPDGIMEAHEKLHAMVPFSTERRYFGLSRPENNGEIVYRAATEEMMPGEAEKYNCNTLLIRKGNYTSVLIRDYVKDPECIKDAFDELLSHPELDPDGYCVEWYLNENDVNCMIRLAY